MLRSTIHVRAGLVLALAASISCDDARPAPYGEYPNFAALDSAFNGNGTLGELAEVLRPNGWSIGVYDAGGSRWCGQTFFNRALRKTIYATVYCAGGDVIDHLSEKSVSVAEMQAQVEDTAYWLKPGLPFQTDNVLPAAEGTTGSYDTGIEIVGTALGDVCAARVVGTRIPAGSLQSLPSDTQKIYLSCVVQTGRLIESMQPTSDYCAAVTEIAARSKLSNDEFVIVHSVLNCRLNLR